MEMIVKKGGLLEGVVFFFCFCCFCCLFSFGKGCEALSFVSSLSSWRQNVAMAISQGDCGQGTNEQQEGKRGERKEEFCEKEGV